MRRDRRSIERSLERKGFTRAPGSKHILYKYFFEGKFTGVSTAVSRGSGGEEIGAPLLDKMASDLNLPNAEFLRFVDCPMEAGEYADHLRGLGLLPNRVSASRILTDAEIISAGHRIRALIEEQNEDHRIYELFGKWDSGTFTWQDLEVLEEIEAANAEA